MIVRIWTAETAEDKAEEYRRHFVDEVLPDLRGVDGFRGATLLERRHKENVEFVVTTRWDSIDAIRTFAGHHHDKAVVEERARAALDRFDEEVKHYVVAFEENR